MTTSTNSFSTTKTWIWQDFPICYQTQGTTGPAVILIHGFGASWRHWRKNIPALAANCRVYAIDLIGFGGSAKPKPGEKITYTLETWGQQVADFCQEVVGEPAFLVGNSIGCIVAMQAAVISPDMALGTALLNCSLRLLHDRKRVTLPWLKRFGAPMLQNFLAIQAVGDFFFNRLAQPKTVKKILLQAYANGETVTDELVDILMTPAKDPGETKLLIQADSYNVKTVTRDSHRVCSLIT